jgi:murein DD-endopeptidase MepM/ murein hydrolase activator NlpD
MWGALFLQLPILLLLVHYLVAGSGASAEGPPASIESGGGEYAVPHVPHLTETERQTIQQTIEHNLEQLALEGKLAAPRAEAAVSLGWPLQPAATLSDPGYYGTTFFVDHNPAYPNQLRDYACGARTHDSSSGYNHQGTDFFLWPFAWNKMAAGAVRVVAAAPGVIIHRQDGNPDQSCTFNSQSWNAIYVRHADNSIAWYGHLKRASLTAKGVGEVVAAGEYLGLVGSSGNSTGPHLHFELHDASFKLIDPYAGSCNTMNGQSWWMTQPAYYDSAVNKLTTGRAAVQFQSCPNPDVTNEALFFQPGETIYFTTYYRDQLSSQQSNYRILRPNGSVYVAWNHNSPASHYVLSYWYWAYKLPTTGPTGTWTFEVTFQGHIYRHNFYIGTPSTPTATLPQPSPTPAMTPTPTATRPPFLPRDSFVPLLVAAPAE